VLFYRQSQPYRLQWYLSLAELKAMREVRSPDQQSTLFFAFFWTNASVHPIDLLIMSFTVLWMNCDFKAFLYSLSKLSLKSDYLAFNLLRQIVSPYTSLQDAVVHESASLQDIDLKVDWAWGTLHSKNTCRTQLVLCTVILSDKTKYWKFCNVMTNAQKFNFAFNIVSVNLSEVKIFKNFLQVTFDSLYLLFSEWNPYNIIIKLLNCSAYIGWGSWNLY